MAWAERVLYHQVHPLKLTTDVTMAIASLALFWWHEVVPGLLIAIVPPIVVSAVLLRTADLESYRDGAIGAYVRRFMTPVVQLLRLIGFGVSAVGAWRQEPLVVLAGLLLVCGCWSYGLVVRVAERRWRQSLRRGVR